MIIDSVTSKQKEKIDLYYHHHMPDVDQYHMPILHNLYVRWAYDITSY